MTEEDGTPRLDIREGATREPLPARFQKAVALKYDKEDAPAPRIVAKGSGYVAEQILQLAFAHDGKVREDAALVDMLAKLELESLIPLEAYAAVAEILSYVYRANQAMGKQPEQ